MLKKEISKGQFIRLCDVFLIGPFIIYAGSLKSTLPDSVKIGLIFIGIITIAYNGKNFLKNINN